MKKELVVACVGRCEIIVHYTAKVVEANLEIDRLVWNSTLVPRGGQVQSSLQTRRQDSDVWHRQRTLLPDTNNTTLFLLF